MPRKGEKSPREGKGLNLPQTTIYLPEDLRSWLVEHARLQSESLGTPVSMTSIIRVILQNYRKKIEKSDS